MTFALILSLLGGDEKPIALRVGKILTMSGAPINDGVIVIRGGKLDRVGPAFSTPVPPDADVIDLRDRWAATGGLWAAPGFIDLHAHIGGGDTYDINDMVHPTNPGLGTRATIDPGCDQLKRAVAGGVTTILYIPGSGTNLGGMGTLMHTGGGRTIDDLVLRFPGVMKVAQAWNPERMGGDLGASRTGMWWMLREMLDRGRAYNDAWTAFESGRTKIEPARESELELIRGLFQGKFPVIIHTADARDVMGTIRMFNDEYGLTTIATHGEEQGYKVAHEAGKRPNVFVNVGPRTIDPPTWAIDVKQIGIAEAYRAGGVKNLSICTDSDVVPEEELQTQAAACVWLGLPEEAALRGVTIEGARAIGMAERLGSLEVGKDADVVVWTGDPLDVRSYVVLTIIGGKIVYDLRKDERRL